MYASCCAEAPDVEKNVAHEVGLNARSRIGIAMFSNRSDLKSQSASRIAPKIATKSVERLVTFLPSHRPPGQPD